MIARTTAEAIVTLATSAIVMVLATTQLRPLPIYASHTYHVPPFSFLPLVVLAATTIFAEHLAGARLGALYRQRSDATTGLALGTLALPWAAAGLAAKQQAAMLAGGASLTAPAAMLHASLAASAAAVLALMWHGGLLGSLKATWDGQAPRRRVGYQQLPLMPLDGTAQVLVALPLAIVLLYAVAAEAASSAWHGAVLLAVAAVAASCLLLLLELLPATFTVGEAVVAAEAAALLGSAALQLAVSQLLLWFSGEAGAAATAGTAAGSSPSQRFVVFLSAGSLLCSALLIPLLLRGHRGRQSNPRQPRPQQQQPQWRGSRLPSLAVAAVAVAALAAAAAAPAALWAVRLALSSRRRVLLCCWWAADLAAALPIMGWLSRSGRVRSILVRKGYHLLAVSLFLPALLLEPQLLGVALAAAFALLLALEALRVSGLPGVAHHVHAFMTSFTDSRDAGLLLITHFTLLLGMAAPIWLSNALDARTVGAATAAGGPDGASGVAGAQWQRPQGVWLPAYAGIMILGLGDTAASAVGSLFGRHPICHGTRKTVEGTAAGIAATLAGWWLLSAAFPGGGGSSSSSSGSGGWAAGGVQIGSWGHLAAATAFSCLLEAVTTQLDNVFMPLHYFALLCLL